MQLLPTTITQKGQVTIPAPVRRLMRVKPGDQVEFVVEKNKEVTVKPAKRFDIMSLYGSLKPKVRPGLTGQALIKWEEEAWPQAAAERDLRILREARHSKTHNVALKFPKYSYGARDSFETNSHPLC